MKLVAPQHCAEVYCAKSYPKPMKNAAQDGKTFICASTQSMACAVPIFTKFTATPRHYITIFYTEFYQHRSRSMELTGRKAFTNASKHVTAPIVAISNFNYCKLASIVGLSDCHLYACHTDGTNKQRYRYSDTRPSSCGKSLMWPSPILTHNG